MTSNASRTRGQFTNQQRKAQLASLARKSFLEAGYRGTTTKELATTAGVSEALIIKHFGSKKELFRYSVVDPLLQMLTGAVAREPFVKQSTMREAHDDVQGFLLGWARIVKEDGPLLWTILRETRDFPEVAASIIDRLRGQVEQFAKDMAHTAERPEYRPHNVRVATYVGLAAATMGGLVSDDLEGFVAEAVEILFVGILSADGREALRGKAI